MEHGINILDLKNLVQNPWTLTIFQILFEDHLFEETSWHCSHALWVLLLASCKVIWLSSISRKQVVTIRGRYETDSRILIFLGAQFHILFYFFFQLALFYNHFLWDSPVKTCILLGANIFHYTPTALSLWTCLSTKQVQKHKNNSVWPQALWPIISSFFSCIVSQKSISIIQSAAWGNFPNFFLL